MNKMNILIVEDEIGIGNFMEKTLTAAGYKVVSAKTGKQALTLVISQCPDLVLLDLGLPDIDGTEIIRKVREWSSVPIVVVSARGTEEDKVEALDYGADDYITKPFGTSELLARIRTAYRHSLKMANGTENVDFIYHSGELMVDLNKRLVRLADEEIHLTQIEYKIIALLVKNSGRVLTYDAIIKEIWGPLAVKENQILRVNMANIRRKIEKNPANPKYIFTEVGVGYRMIEEE